jgi:teichuronic acid biosynthesis glycosyltransferase TuaC
MRIGVVSALFPSRKSPSFGVFVREQCAQLAAHEDVRVIAPLPNQHWRGVAYHDSGGLEIPVVRPFTLAFPRWFMQHRYPASMASTLRRTGRRFFADRELVHAHNAFPEGQATVRAFGDDIPVVVTLHGSDINLFARNPTLRPGIVDALNRAARVICVGSALVRSVRSLGVEAPTEVIPNGVDTVLFSPGDRETAAQRLGLDTARPRIIFVGWFVPVKGIEYLIDAMPRVMAAIPDCELVLLGARPGTGDSGCYRSAIERAGIAANTRIMETRPHHELPDWMRASDVLVLPSIAEGFGLVAAEAMAVGRPVVATRCGGPEDIVTGETGRLVSPRDSEALAEALIAVIRGEGVASPEVIARSARDRFAFDTIVARILGVYADILGER